ncbi:MAG: hypothetical protein J6J66_03225 [Clostridia bacterium]|nr:hypothetical protein [Clostridia bacterium]
MKKTQKNGISEEKLEMMTLAQREAMQRESEKRRLTVTQAIEDLLSEISSKKSGKSLRMKNPKRLGQRPNDTLED